MRPKNFPRLHGRDHRSDGRDPIPIAIAFQKVGSEAGAGAGLTIADEGTPVPLEPVLNFTGPGVTATDNPASHRTDITITGGGTALQIADEGSVLPAEPTLNFTGAGVTATTDTVNNRTDVTIPGGGGSPPTNAVLFDTYPQTAQYLAFTATNGGISLEQADAGNGNVIAITNKDDGNIVISADGDGAINIQTAGAGDLVLQLNGTGRLIMDGLPTTAPGLTGAVWNDGGTLKIA